ncbi:MAG: hypothetical protein NTW69_06445 [Chloroflexi bacterium]|nr:hypothetical protein [Chloroflexota bacterium]
MTPLNISVTVEDEETKETVIVYGSVEVLKALLSGTKISIAQIAEKFKADEVLISALTENFHIDPANQQIWTATNEIQTILRDLKTMNETQFDNRRITSALMELGIAHPKSKRNADTIIRGYYGIQPKRA